MLSYGIPHGNNNLTGYQYIVLETGRLVLSGTGKELTGNPRVKEAYLGG
jgi:branched-chain amino acid transport system ATP-binding protein